MKDDLKKCNIKWNLKKYENYYLKYLCFYVSE